MPPGGRARGAAHLASIVVDDKASAPAVEVLVGAHGPLQLLQQRLVGATARGVHGGAHVVQDAHDAWGALRARGGGSSTKSFIRVGVEGVGVQVCVGGLLWNLPVSHKGSTPLALPQTGRLGGGSVSIDPSGPEQAGRGNVC